VLWHCCLNKDSCCVKVPLWQSPVVYLEIFRAPGKWLSRHLSVMFLQFFRVSLLNKQSTLHVCVCVYLTGANSGSLIQYFKRFVFLFSWSFLLLKNHLFKLHRVVERFHFYCSHWECTPCFLFTAACWLMVQ